MSSYVKRASRSREVAFFGHSSPAKTRPDPAVFFIVCIFVLPLPLPLPLPGRDILRRLSLSPASAKRDLRRSVSSEDLLAGLRIGVRWQLL